jgi:hypothetical protein
MTHTQRSKARKQIAHSRHYEINAMRAELDAMQAQTDSANARINAMITAHSAQ